MFLPGMYAGRTQSGADAPQNWFSAALASMGGGKSKAGIHVTPENAIGFIAVYACVKLLSESVAQLPCNLYRRTDKDGGREKATDHPLYDKLRHAPNGWQTGFDYHEYMQGGLGLRGNAYAFVERNNRGQVTDIVPLNPGRVNVRVAADRRPVYDLLDENQKDVPFSRMHHIAAFKTNAYVGMSPIQAGREGLGLAMVTEEHASTVFSQGTHIKGALERDWKDGTKPLSKPQVDELKNQWQQLYGGVANSGQIAVLQDGFKFKGIAMSNVDADLMASRIHGINDACRLYNIPPHMVQLLDKATFSNIEHQGLQFVMYSLMPWLRRHEAAQMRDFLTARERANHYIEYNVSSLMRGDTTSRFESYAKGRQWGWLSANDIRRMENQPTIPNGDEYLRPLNMVEAGQGGLPPLTKAEQRELDAIKDLSNG